MKYIIVAGTTKALQFQLLEGGSPIDLTSCSVTLLLTNRLGTDVSSPGTVTITAASTGKVQLAPTDANVFDATKSPYMARWKITDGSAKVSYVPDAPARDVWEIVKA